MRVLILAAILLVSLVAPRLAAAGGCSAPTVTLVDLSPPRAPIPANGNWGPEALEAQDRWRAALRSALEGHPGVRFVDFGREPTRAERKALRRIADRGLQAKTPRFLRDLRSAAQPDRAGSRIDTVVVLHIPRNLLEPTTIAVIGLHEGRVAALLRGVELATTTSLVPALVDVASATRCSI